MKLLFVVISTLVTTAAWAESYTSYVDPLVQNTVSLTYSGSKIDNEKVLLNGRNEYATNVVVSTQDELLIKTQYGNVIISIPKSVQRGQWNHQTPGLFRSGDTRILNGDMIINGRPVQRLVEIAAE